MTEELYKRYRPTKLDDLIGQDAAVNSLESYLEAGNLPHTILLTGPSGCGKTTIARILRDELKCNPARNYHEINAASKQWRGIDSTDHIATFMNITPQGGRTSIWVIDECHQLTRQAQEAFLKILEDTPAHVYFILITTEPNKLKESIRTRCCKIKVERLKSEDMEDLVGGTAEDERKKISDSVVEAIIDTAEGSPRNALTMLDQVIDVDDEKEQLQLIKQTSVMKDAEFLARPLLNRASWPKITKCLRELVDDDAEGMRRKILLYVAKVAINNSKQTDRACEIIDLFSEHFYDSGFAGLVNACYEASLPPEKEK